MDNTHYGFGILKSSNIQPKGLVAYADGDDHMFVTNAYVANKQETLIFFRLGDGRLFLLNVGQRYSTRDGGFVEIINLYPELLNTLGASRYLQYSSHVCIYNEVEYRRVDHFIFKETDVVRRPRTRYEETL